MEKDAGSGGIGLNLIDDVRREGHRRIEEKAGTAAVEKNLIRAYNRYALTNKEENGRAFLPFITGVTDRIEGLLRKRKARNIFRPTKSIQRHLTSAIDASNPLSSGQVYTSPW